MVRLCFQRKNKTLSAIFKNKKVIEMLKQNYETFCSLNNKVVVEDVHEKQAPEERDTKEVVLSVLEESGNDAVE